MKRTASKFFRRATLLALCVAGQAFGQPAPGAAGTGLEATGPAVKSPPDAGPFSRPGALGASKLKPAASAPAAPPSAPSSMRASAPLQQDRTGKLESYIRNNEAARKAEGLRSDPRLNALSQQARGDFLNEFGVLMFSKAVPSRDSLLERTRALDKEQMEKTDRHFKFREDAAQFQTDEAILAREIEDHNKKANALAKDVQAYESDKSAFEAAASNYRGRLESHNADARAHAAEVASYTAACVGAPLPPGPYQRCVSWQQSLNSRRDSINARKAVLDAERDRLLQSESALKSRYAGLESRRREIDASKARLDPRYDANEKRRAELVAEEKKLADWDATLQPQWDFELKRINEWIALLERFNARLEQALARVPPPKPPTSPFTGSWSDGDRQIVNQSLNGLKDADLRKWIATRAELNRYKTDTFSPITANGSTLRFKDGFFQEQPARRENLIAFEAGKVFWNAMKERQVKDPADPNRTTTLEEWFSANANGRVIAEMKKAKHGGVDFSQLGDIDAPSQFGYMFRTQALQIAPPGGSSRQEWDRSTRAFRAVVNPLLHSSP